MDVALLVFLILLNGAFAMSEMALTASRKARLQVMVEAGEPGAQAAMDLHENPTKFLSTVQIGITSIGVLNGIVGEAAFAEPLAAWLQRRFGMPERAADISRHRPGGGDHHLPHHHLRRAGAQAPGPDVPRNGGAPGGAADGVAVLRRAALRAAAVLVAPTRCSACWASRTGPNRSVTEEEIAASLEEGLDAGVIEAQEHQMVRNVFRLDERQIGSMMIPRGDIVWLDADAPMEEALAHDRAQRAFPLPGVPRRAGRRDRRGRRAAELLQQVAQGQPLQLTEHLQPPVFVPETLSGMELLEQLSRLDHADWCSWWTSTARCRA